MDLWNLDAVAQADLVRRKEVRPAELVESAIARIQRLNPRVNAVITPMFEQAREAAAGPLPDGPLRGVPFLLKDLIAEYAGLPLFEGSAFLKDYVSPVDSEIVRRWKAAGLVAVGKTNTAELGMVPAVEPILFGRTCNPWDPSLSPGGSSGGSAAAVALGMAAAAHGNDAGGSIRIPASSCGLFGLKPTRGRNPLGPHYGDIGSGIVAEHVLTRSVRDSATILDATAGPDLGDPYAAPAEHQGPYARLLGGRPRRLRVGFSITAPADIGVHADCVRAVREAAALCERLGHDVEEAAPAFDADGLGVAMAQLWAALTAWSIDDWSRRTGQPKAAEKFEASTWRLAESGWRLTSAEYLLAVQDVQRMTRDIARFFVDHDVWLTPVMATPPLPPGSFRYRPEDPSRGPANLLAYLAFVRIANATGQPAMAVPLSWNEQGIPIGVQFVGRYGDESTLLRLAGQLEEAQPWADRWPAMAQNVP